MLIGPVFTRELTLTPRRGRTYFSRSAYGFVLLLLIATAWLVLTGSQRIRDVGDVARFGMSLFQVLAPLQSAVAIFFSAMLAAGEVSQEKDRKTLDLLLMTKMSNSELVLGKLFAGLLHVFMLAVAALPIFMLCALFGGVSFEQIVRVFAATCCTILLCGSLGSTVALWREKTFQALAMTLLILVLWLAVWRVAALGGFGTHWGGVSCETIAAAMSPWEAILEASRPFCSTDPALGALRHPLHLFYPTSILLAVLLNGTAILRIRVWNPSREAHAFRREDETWHRASIWGAEFDAARAAKQGEAAGATAAAAPAAKKSSHRRVWDNPIVWREIATWAYGRKILVVRLAYLAAFAAAFAALAWLHHTGQPVTRATGVTLLAPLFLLSLVLVNAQAVTAVTSERDAKALDLLLVSDLTPKEIVYGKLGGVFYNTKEMVALPLLLCGYLWHIRVVGPENACYLVLGLGVLYLFTAVLGLHVGIHYVSSRTAIATSLGTVFFLFLGVATGIWMMVAFSGSFGAQLQPFIALMLGGGVGLYAALGARNPSPAIGVASFLCPFATFYSITSFFLNQNLAVCLVTASAYGFTTAAMLVPAIFEFDVATGRTTAGE